MVGGQRPDHVLDRKPRPLEVVARLELHRLQVLEQGRPVVPRHVGRPLDHVVAEQSRHRDGRRLDDLQPGGHRLEVAHDRLEPDLVPADQVHLVDGQDEVGDAEQAGDRRVAPGLLEQPLAGVDQDDGEIGGRRAGHHVPRVLHVARRVGDDELASRRGEVAVGDVDGDALLAFGPQPVGEQGQVDVVVATLGTRALDGLHLVLEDGLRVVEEAADQRRLAVVDRPGGGEPQHLHGADQSGGRSGEDELRSSPPACGPPWLPRRTCRRPGWRPAR